MPENNSEERIIELETKLSYQEDLLQELNANVITQQAQIDKLNHHLDLLKDQFKEVMLTMPDVVASNERPPHY